MSAPWSWWWSGLALAAIAMGHWILVGRLFAVSGRFTALVDRARFGPAPAMDMTEAELISAMRALSVQEFGADAVSEPAVPAPASETAKAPQTVSTHLVFVACVVLGGALAAVTSGAFAPRLHLASALLPRLVGTAPLGVPLVLLGGGALVGFGTRLAGGCTSGHGLCGVSRLQPGSLVTTISFFGTGVLVSLLLSRFL